MIDVGSQNNPQESNLVCLPETSSKRGPHELGRSISSTIVLKSIRLRVLGIDFEGHPVVFPVSAMLVLAFVLGTAWAPRRALLLFEQLQSWISNGFGWLYVGSMTSFLCFAIYLALSPFGRIKLGPEDSKPEFSTITWFAMLFSAGMGIGMLFFGVAEPMMHFVSPPDIEGETLLAARQAMATTLFHWCLHPWALYALVGLSLAYFSFRKGLPLSFRSVFFPLLGHRVSGRIGDAIDILAVLATLFGLATSLGLGAKQVNAGLSHVFGLPQDTLVQVALITCITAAAVASLVSGLHVGVRRLSELNMLLAGALLLFLFIAGPSVYLLRALVENTGAYLEALPRTSFRTGSYANETSSAWVSSWTVFYWGWWIAWSPFVGMFIARVSLGRTIREFITGVLLVPSAVAIIWMTGFGSSALHQEIHSKLAGKQDQATSYDYAAHTYNVQDLDASSGLPLTEEGGRLVGPTAKGTASQSGVLLEQTKAGFRTESGTNVEYYRGVLIDAVTREPYVPAIDETYEGPFAAHDQQLTLAGYLGSPVLNAAGTSRVDTTATAMFVMLEAYPLSSITTLIATLSVILFFITSSDSASLVADIIASGGSPNPALGTRLFWGISEGVLASVLLVAGGLKALQTGAITIGLPFCIMIILMCWSLFQALREETAVSTATGGHEDNWTKR